MGIFNKRNQKDKLCDEVTLISSKTKINGEFDLKSNLHIDGEVEGKVHSTFMISVGKSGRFKGEMRAHSVVISGVFFGKVEASTVEIMSGGRLIGNVVAENLVIHDCGIFDGTRQYKETQNEEAQKPPTKD